MIRWFVMGKKSKKIFFSHLSTICAASPTSSLKHKKKYSFFFLAAQCCGLAISCQMVNLTIIHFLSVCLFVRTLNSFQTTGGGGGGSRNYKGLTRALPCKFSRKFSLDWMIMDVILSIGVVWWLERLRNDQDQWNLACGLHKTESMLHPVGVVCLLYYNRVGFRVGKKKGKVLSNRNISLGGGI